jgi:hypothetical protein
MTWIISGIVLLGIYCIYTWIKAQKYGNELKNIENRIIEIAKRNEIDPEEYIRLSLIATAYFNENRNKRINFSDYMDFMKSHITKDTYSHRRIFEIIYDQSFRNLPELSFEVRLNDTSDKTFESIFPKTTNPKKDDLLKESYQRYFELHGTTQLDKNEWNAIIHIFDKRITKAPINERTFPDVVRFIHSIACEFDCRTYRRLMEIIYDSMYFDAGEEVQAKPRGTITSDEVLGTPCPTIYKGMP